MNYYIFILLTISISMTISQSPNHVESVNATVLNNIQSIFGTPPSLTGLSTTTLTDLPTPVPLSNVFDNNTLIYATRPTPTIAPKRPCECVAYYWCKDDGTFNTDGEGLYSIRLDDEDEETECPNYMLFCCEKEKILRQKRLPKPLPPRKGCGYRRPKGIAIKAEPKKGQAKYGELPWMVAILTQDFDKNGKIVKKYRCGGALIHRKAVLTAAHCVEENMQYYIRAGEWDTQQNLEVYPHVEVAVKDVISHEDYRYSGLHNDVAVLILEKEIPYQEHIDVMCLPPQDFVADDNADCIASGWGKKNFERQAQYQTILKKINLPFVERKRCQDWLRTTRLGPYFKLHESLVCAGGRKGEDTCEGDGGGPLVCPISGQPNRYHQIGMVAWGLDCGNDVPAAYVNVALFRKWIDSVMKSNGLDTSEYNYLPITVKIDEVRIT